MHNKLLKSWICAFALLLFSCNLLARDAGRLDSVALSALPTDARRTLEQIKQGGPFPYPKDGSVFGNYEKNLPKQRRGYYREFTVPTPGIRSRGARRIIAGGDPASFNEFFYTADHYRTFQRIRN